MTFGPKANREEEEEEEEQEEQQDKEEEEEEEEEEELIVEQNQILTPFHLSVPSNSTQFSYYLPLHSCVVEQVYSMQGGFDVNVDWWY